MITCKIWFYLPRLKPATIGTWMSAGMSIGALALCNHKVKNWQPSELLEWNRLNIILERKRHRRATKFSHSLSLLGFCPTHQKFCINKGNGKGRRGYMERWVTDNSIHTLMGCRKKGKQISPCFEHFMQAPMLCERHMQLF